MNIYQLLYERRIIVFIIVFQMREWPEQFLTGRYRLNFSFSIFFPFYEEIPEFHRDVFDGSGQGQSCLCVTFAGTFSPCKTIHHLELVIGKPADVSSENKTFRELQMGPKETMLICVQIEMLKICAMLRRESSRESAFFLQLVEKFEYRLIARRIS